MRILSNSVTVSSVGVTINRQPEIPTYTHPGVAKSNACAGFSTPNLAT